MIPGLCISRRLGIISSSIKYSIKTVYTAIAAARTGTTMATVEGLQSAGRQDWSDPATAAQNTGLASAIGSLIGALASGADYDTISAAENDGGARRAKDVNLPKNDSQLKHVLRDADGHLPDTPENWRKKR